MPFVKNTLLQNDIYFHGLHSCEQGWINLSQTDFIFNFVFMIIKCKCIVLKKNDNERHKYKRQLFIYWLYLSCSNKVNRQLIVK